ncbi:hypothetical protein ACQJBY_059381 [Aegilops geniculata]|uniref:Uncharacterized protein n=1 Tax=Triticum turgidum subsp. durum TaxID=4567 RepID=A0A9R0Y071_TRITD|nr:unnamed protein product [Triticum turgidum subsp. durum]
MMATKLQYQFITLEKNGKILKLFPREVSTDQIAAIEDAYLNMASALSEADGIDYTNPEELELLVAALIDLDAMDGKKSVSLIVECSSSPDVNTRCIAAFCDFILLHFPFFNLICNQVLFVVYVHLLIISYNF